MLNSIYSFIKRGGALFMFLAFIIILNHQTGYISLVTVFSVAVLFIFISKAKIDIYSILIIIFGVFYYTISAINGYENNIQTTVICYIAPFFFYQYGYYFPSRFRTDDSITVAWTIIVICYCLDIFCIATGNILSSGELIAEQRSLMFGGESGYSMSATLVGLSLDIGMIGLAMAIIVKNKYMRIVYILMFFFSLLTTIHLLNRTAIAVAMLCTLTLIAYKSRNDIRTLILSVVVILSISAILIYFGIVNDDIISLYKERNVDLSTMGTRTTRWKDAIGNILIYPFGWGTMGQEFNIHNMWLDIARIAGIIPFLILSYLTINTFIKTIRLLISHERTISYLLLGLNICFFASCFVEPIYGGTHLNLYFMLMGTVNYLTRKNRIKREVQQTKPNIN